MSDSETAISGSRDTTLRVWDIKKGVCKNVLVGHQASVRCLEIKGDIVVSGSYDTTARVWSISEGRCLRVLSGHFSQIYAIAFDGNRVATGSLDTSVRIWDPNNGYGAIPRLCRVSLTTDFLGHVKPSSKDTPRWSVSFRCGGIHWLLEALMGQSGFGH
jgi:WD40 repeat protein